LKITEVNVYFVRPRWGFVEIITDSGLTGWGEAVAQLEEPRLAPRRRKRGGMVAFTQTQR